MVMADCCLDEFTDHGHCGVVDAGTGRVDNDATLALYAEVALAQAAAGADVVAPSGMMDGQVAAIRAGLDEAGHGDTAVLAYAAKYASALYGPFREAVDVTIADGGDRNGYQQDSGNRREALDEVALDIAEGADMVMVKPALTYLDVIAAVRAAVDVPVARLPREWGVRHGQGGGRAGLDRRPGRRPRAADRHQAGRRRPHPHLLRRPSWPRSWVAEPRRSRRALFERAARVIPGGVNSPVRARSARWAATRTSWPGARAPTSGTPTATGYLDFVQSYGASMLGHAHPAVVEAVRQAAGRGTTFGAPTEGEVRLAEAISGRVEGCEQVRLVSSGTEAAMSAVRVARGFTGRPRIVKFAGCYHGHSDGLLAGGGSGVATLGLPDSAGVPLGAVADTVVAPYNRSPSSTSRWPASSSSRWPPTWAWSPRPPASWPGLRAACDAAGALLVFDEVITGFRLGGGGATAWSGVRPDLWCFGKVIGGGLPVGAFGGRREVLAMLAPEGPVYQAGTLSGNPLATAAGLAVLGEVDAASYAGLSERVADFGAPSGVRPPGRPPRPRRPRPGSRWSARCWGSSSRRPGRAAGAPTSTAPRPRWPPGSTPAFPRDAGPGDRPGAGTLRGGLHLPGPRGRRPRPHGGGGGRAIADVVSD